ncbi:MAG: LytR C-terminal domain-containing protein [Patescibacteria group bacterium]
MLKNKIKKTKTLKIEKLTYPLIFALYLIGIIIAFILMIKFINQALSSALEPAEKQVAPEKILQLDLDNYLLLAKKLNLTKPVSDELISENKEIKSEEDELGIIVNEDETTRLETGDELGTNNEQGENIPAANDSAPVQDDSASIKAKAPLNLKISVLNSTNRAGLAGEMKKILDQAGYPVENIGNQAKSEEATLIKIKSGLDRNASELLEISRLVDEKYDFIVETLGNDIRYDLQIVIGNK